MKKAITISVITIIGLLLAVLIFLSIRSSRIVYNNDNAIGNSAGNLNNGGLFCEYNDKIYFANPYDYNKLYVMNSDCTNAMNVDNILKYIAVHTFVVNDDSLSGTIALSGNSLYYQHYSDTTPLAFHKVDIAGKKDTKISDTPYSPACVHNGTIYFSDPVGKHNILSYDTKTDKTSVLYDCNSYLADVENGYAYYIDLSKNYSLVRLNTSNKTLELLYGEKGNKVVNYNVYGNKIFFQVESTDGMTGLYRMNIDGTQIETIAIGNITNIHCTSKYTFFQYYEDQGVLYRVSTSGADTSVEQITIK